MPMLMLLVLLLSIIAAILLATSTFRRRSANATGTTVLRQVCVPSKNCAGDKAEPKAIRRSLQCDSGVRRI